MAQERHDRRRRDTGDREQGEVARRALDPKTSVAGSEHAFIITIITITMPIIIIIIPIRNPNPNPNLNPYIIIIIITIIIIKIIVIIISIIIVSATVAIAIAMLVVLLVAAVAFTVHIIISPTIVMSSNSGSSSSSSRSSKRSSCLQANPALRNVFWRTFSWNISIQPAYNWSASTNSHGIEITSLDESDMLRPVSISGFNPVHLYSFNILSLLLHLLPSAI